MAKTIKVHLFPRKINSKRHKHHNSIGWFNVFYYRKSKKTPAEYEVRLLNEVNLVTKIAQKQLRVIIPVIVL